jgi:hypothetical protein
MCVEHCALALRPSPPLKAFFSWRVASLPLLRIADSYYLPCDSSLRNPCCLRKYTLPALPIDRHQCIVMGFLLVFAYIESTLYIGIAAMKLNDIKAYNGCPDLEPITKALAHLVSIQRERYEREKATKRQISQTRRNRSLPAE